MMTRFWSTHSWRWMGYLMAIVLIFLGVSQVYLACSQWYEAYLMEEQRLQHLDVESLDLPFIINYIDELGGDEIQLNWKEIIPIVAAMKSNYVSGITTDDLTTVAQYYLERIPQPSFEEVLSQWDIPTKWETRLQQYYADLTYYGYTPHKLQPNSPQMTFIHQIQEGAIQNYFESGILPSITIAQAILESNWGQSVLALEGRNLFGIKKGKGWLGDTLTIQTREYYDEVIWDEFRSYSHIFESIDDHSRFLTSNPRYQDAGVFEAKTYRQQAFALQEAGYSTAQDEQGNKTYAKLLGELIRQYNLQLIDHEVQNHYPI